MGVLLQFDRLDRWDRVLDKPSQPWESGENESTLMKLIDDALAKSPGLNFYVAPGFKIERRKKIKVFPLNLEK